MIIRPVALLCAPAMLAALVGLSPAAELGQSDDYRDKFREERTTSSRAETPRSSRPRSEASSTANDTYERGTSSRSSARRRDTDSQYDRSSSRRSADDARSDRYRDRDTDDDLRREDLRRDERSPRYSEDRTRSRSRDSSVRYPTTASDRDYLRRRVAQLPGEMPSPDDAPYETLSEPQSVRLGQPVFGVPGGESVAPPYSSNYPIPQYMSGETEMMYGPPPGSYGPPQQGGGYFAPAVWGQPGCLAHCGPKFGVSMFGDFLYLSPRGIAVPFASPTDGIGQFGSVPMGATGTINPDYSPGFRVGGAVIIAPCSRIMGSYTWLQTTTNDAITAPAGTVIDPLVAYPGTYNAGFISDSASAFYNINLQLADASYETLLVNTERSWLGVFGGGAYTRLEQQFGATYPFSPPNGTTIVNSNVDFNGGGLQLGLEGEQRIWKCYGFCVYGRGLSRFLVGKFQSSYTQTNQFNGTEVSTSSTDNRIVPVLDLELGLSWVSPRSFVRLYGGYLISAWFNSVTTPGWIQSVHDASYFAGPAFLPATTNLTTLTFDGLVARAEVAF